MAVAGGGYHSLGLRVAPTIPGDLDGNGGDVDMEDFSVFQSVLTGTGLSKLYPIGAFNG